MHYLKEAAASAECVCAPLSTRSKTISITGQLLSFTMHFQSIYEYVRWYAMRFLRTTNILAQFETGFVPKIPGKSMGYNSNGHRQQLTATFRAVVIVVVDVNVRPCWYRHMLCMPLSESYFE